MARKIETDIATRNGQTKKHNQKWSIIPILIGKRKRKIAVKIVRDEGGKLVLRDIERN